MNKDPSYLYKNKYRIESARLKNWDYSSDGWYYVTICEKNRECVFGNIINNKMILSEVGRNAQQCWREIPDHFPFVKLDEFVIMPNHVHGIIIIDKSGEPVETQNLASLKSVNHVKIQNAETQNAETQNLASLKSVNYVEIQNVETQNVETQNLASLKSVNHVKIQNAETQNAETQNLASLRQPNTKYGLQSRNLASIIRGFKIGVTKYAKNNNIPFIWQPRFYDHIVRDDEDLNRIRKYIIDNPLNWDADENNVKSCS